MFNFLAADTSLSIDDQIFKLIEGAPWLGLSLLWIYDKIGNNSERNYLRQRNQELEQIVLAQAESLRKATEALTTALALVQQASHK